MHKSKVVANSELGNCLQLKSMLETLLEVKQLPSHTRCGYGLIVAEPQQVVNQIFMSALTAAFLALTISLF